MTGLKVITYIVCQDGVDPTSQKVTDLKNLFTTPVNVVSIDVPDIPFPKTLTKEQMTEISRFIYCLTDARKSNPDHHIMVLRSDSVSNVSSKELTEILTEISKSEHDLAYLCKWNDACEKYDFELASKLGKSVLLGSHSPHGTQALVISPSCRDKLLGLISMANSQKIQDYTVGLSDLLNHHITHKNLEALTIVPNAFDVDPTTVKNPKDLIKKMNQCSTTGSTSNVTYIIIGALIALIITIVIILLMKKKN